MRENQEGMFSRGATGAALILALLLGSERAFADDASARQVASGRAFAQRVCSACHVVSRDGAPAPLLRSPGPAFPDIARRQEFSTSWLKEFLESNHSQVGPHEAMPNPALVGYQIDELVAYFDSLKTTN